MEPILILNKQTNEKKGIYKKLFYAVLCKEWCLIRKITNLGGARPYKEKVEWFLHRQMVSVDSLDFQKKYM